MTQTDDEIETLLREAGPREQPTAEHLQRARQVSHQAWAQAAAAHRSRRWQRTGMGIAAVLVLGFALSITVSSVAGFEIEVVQATGLHIDGTRPRSGLVSLEPGSSMTASQATRLVAHNGVDLRLMSDTHLKWLTSSQVYLEAGELYVDTHGTTEFHVDTHQGRIRDIGTRYLVSVTPGSTDLAVRDGIVEVSNNQQTLTARGNGVTAQVVTLNSSGLTVADEQASNSRWNWILEVAPDYSSTSVRKLLEQVCADMGKALFFESPGVEAAVANLRMTTGSLAGTEPMLTLTAIVESSGMRFTQSDKEIRIKF